MFEMSLYFISDTAGDTEVARLSKTNNYYNIKKNTKNYKAALTEMLCDK